MYNNDTTYADKWNTPENEAAYKKLDKKYFDNSYCSPSCPVSWAPEVLELMELLDKELGIERNTDTLRAYYPQGNMVDWFIMSPTKQFFSSFFKNVFGKPTNYKDVPLSIRERISRICDSTIHPVQYGFRVLKITKLNPILNKINKPKLRLSQLKEKYGELNVYFQCPEAHEEWVEREIRKTEIKLAIKGAYYPVESFYYSAMTRSVETEYNPDSISVKENIDSNGHKTVDVSTTLYRQLMKELGLDLKEMKEKADLKRLKDKGMP